MLVLSRKKGERISIGAGIEVTVLGINKGRVKLGFSAPPEVPIRREELPGHCEPDATIDARSDPLCLAGR